MAQLAKKLCAFHISGRFIAVFTRPLSEALLTFHKILRYAKKITFTIWISRRLVDCSSRNQFACFNVTAKSYSVTTRTAEPRRVKTAQNSQRIKASNSVLAN
jgi:hypothetical protein